MTRALATFVFIFSCMSLSRGIDYVTGNSFDRGRLLDDTLTMPMVWGVACLTGALLGFLSIVIREWKLGINAGILNFSINVMLAWQVFHADMLPIPWPPEDVRIVSDHLGHAASWAAIAFTLWWREGIARRASEIVKEAPGEL